MATPNQKKKSNQKNHKNQGSDDKNKKKNIFQRTRNQRFIERRGYYS